MNSTSQSRKWLSLYPKEYLPDLTPEAKNALDHLRKTVQRHGQSPALYYFDKIISYKELDEMSDAFACALKEYDWKTMHRTNRLLVAAVQNELHGGSLSH